MAQSISNIAVTIGANGSQFTLNMTQAAQSIDKVSRASARLNTDLMEQRRVFRALNPAITENDKATDRHVQDARALSVVFSELDAKTIKFSASVQQLAHWHQESAKRMRLYPTGYIGGGFQAVSGVDLSKTAAQIAAVNGHMGRTQGIAQQAVFAVDDFMASFETGGVAGGLRGAANNLTLMAAMLGNIKFQLGAIAAIAGVQLVLGIFTRARAKAMEEMNKGLTKMRDELDKIAQTGEKGADTQFAIWDVKRLKEVSDVQRQIGQNIRDQVKESTLLGSREAAVLETRARLQEAIAEAGLHELRDMFYGTDTARAEALQEELKKRMEAVDASNEDLRNLQSVANALNKQLTITKEIAEQRRQAQIWEQNVVDKMFEQNDLWDAAQKGLDELDKRLDGILNPRGAKVDTIFKQVEADIDAVQQAVINGILDQAEALKIMDDIQRAAQMEIGGLHKPDMSIMGRFPTAEIMGSPGAVSAINQAAFGSQNLRDQQRALKAEETTATEVRRIREAIEKGKTELVQVTI